MPRVERVPKADRLELKLYVPGGPSGATEIIMGNGYLHDKTLVINFNDGLPALAMQRMIARTDVKGITFVTGKEEDVIE